MTASIQVALRHASPVQSLPIETADDLFAAQEWLFAQVPGVSVLVSDLGLTATARGMRLVLRIGQWLVRDVCTGGFSVWEDADYSAAHSEAVA